MTSGSGPAFVEVREGQHRAPRLARADVLEGAGDDQQIHDPEAIAGRAPRAHLGAVARAEVPLGASRFSLHSRAAAHEAG